MKAKVMLALLAMSLTFLTLIGQVASLPYGTMWQVTGTPIAGVSDIWTLTSAPDRRIWGGTSGGYAGSQLFYHLPKVCNSTEALCVLGNPGVEVYALTTSVCGQPIPNVTSYYPYWIYGGSFKANPAWHGPPHGAHLFRYVPKVTVCMDPGWSPGPTALHNPYDMGPWHKLIGGPGIGADSLVPEGTLIYKLSAGPCCKIYGGSGWDQPYTIAGSNAYGDYAYFFVFDPMTASILYWKLFPNATCVIDVLAGRDGRVYFLRQIDQPTKHSVLSVYDPVAPGVLDILDSANIVGHTFMFYSITWCMDHNGNPRIYIGATDIDHTPAQAYLIMVDPLPPYTYPKWISPSSIGTLGVQLGTIRDLTSGLFNEFIYGAAYGATITPGYPIGGYFFMFKPCKGTDPIWGYWNPGTGYCSNPWIAGSPWTGLGPAARLRTIVTGQEAQNGYCVSNQDPNIYVGSGGGTAALFSYRPITADVNLDNQVNIIDIAIVARQFGLDPPENQGPSNLSIAAMVAPIAIASAMTIGLKRRKTAKNKL